MSNIGFQSYRLRLCRFLLIYGGLPFLDVAAVGDGDERELRAVAPAIADFCKRVDVGVRNLQFSIPTKKWIEYADLRSNMKTRDFASEIVAAPGSHRLPYRHSQERSYLEAYSRARYGLTHIKGGWDCMRHYEIIMAGCVPFFLGIEFIPAQTMAAFPKDLIRKLMQLPGVPSESEVVEAIESSKPLQINNSIFPVRRYNELRYALLQHAAKYLLAQHQAARLDVNPLGVLIHWDHGLGVCDYLRDLLIIGLVERGVRIYTTADVSYLFDHGPAPILGKLYGQGFTYTRALHAENNVLVSIFSHGTPPKDEWATITYIKITQGNHGFPDERLLDREADIFIDSNDIAAPHPEAPGTSQLLRRELFSCVDLTSTGQAVLATLNSGELWGPWGFDFQDADYMVNCKDLERIISTWLDAVRRLLDAMQDFDSQGSKASLHEFFEFVLMVSKQVSIIPVTRPNLRDAYKDAADGARDVLEMYRNPSSYACKNTSCAIPPVMYIFMFCKYISVVHEIFLQAWKSDDWQWYCSGT